MVRQRKTHVSTAPTAVPGALLLLAAMMPPLPSDQPRQEEAAWRNHAANVATLRFQLGEYAISDQKPAVWNLPETWNPGAARRQWQHLKPSDRSDLQAAAPGRWKGYELRTSGNSWTTAEAWERYHAGVLKLDGGCAWHVLIDRDGGVSVSERWKGQADGPAEDGAFPDVIRVCFLADDTFGPSTAQWEAADEILDYLETRTGRLKPFARSSNGVFASFEGMRNNLPEI